MIKYLLTILLFLPFGVKSQIQYIEVCTENQEYLQEYWVNTQTPSSTHNWSVQGGLIVSGQGTDIITVNWLNTPYGLYNISVSVEECNSDSSHLLVDIDECSFDNVYVPNCFTVNGDGKNDVWGPVFSGELNDEHYTMYIFNRWGEMIWESRNPLEKWNGQFHNEVCQNGVYVWKMFYRPLNSNTLQTHGHVTLLKQEN